MRSQGDGPGVNPSYVCRRPEVVALVPANARAVLDIGCSDGTNGAELKALAPGRRVVGVEFDPVLASKAAARLDSLIQCDLDDSLCFESLGESVFDCIIFSDVLEHVRDPWTTLRNAMDYLSPDGVVVISLPNVRHVSALWSIFVRGTFPRRDRGLFDRTHLRWFTQNDAVALCSQAGLRVDKITANLRLFDLPKGRVNRVVRACRPLAAVRPIAEFFAYQFLFLASRSRQEPERTQL